MSTETTQNECKTIKLRIFQAQAALKVSSNKTVYNRISKHGWNHWQDESGIAWVEIPEKQILDKRFLAYVDDEDGSVIEGAEDYIALEERIKKIEERFENEYKSVNRQLITAHDTVKEQKELHKLVHYLQKNAEWQSRPMPQKIKDFFTRKKPPKP